MNRREREDTMFYTNGDRPGSFSEWRAALWDPMDPAISLLVKEVQRDASGNLRERLLDLLALVKKNRADRHAADQELTRQGFELARQQLEIRQLEDALSSLSAKVGILMEQERTRAVLEAVERIEGGEDIESVLGDLRPAGSSPEGGAS